MLLRYTKVQVLFSAPNVITDHVWQLLLTFMYQSFYDLIKQYWVYTVPPLLPYFKIYWILVLYEGSSPLSSWPWGLVLYNKVQVWLQHSRSQVCLRGSIVGHLRCLSSYQGSRGWGWLSLHWLWAFRGVIGGPLQGWRGGSKVPHGEGTFEQCHTSTYTNSSRAMN